MQQHTVAYDEGQPRELQEAIVLRDAISDLPPVLSLYLLHYTLIIFFFYLTLNNII